MAASSKRLRRTTLGVLLLGSVAGCAADNARDADVASRLRIASVAEASGQPDVALSVLSTLATSAPDNADVQARFVRALARAGRVHEAQATASQALRRKPGDTTLLLELARVRLIEGKSSEAADAFGAVLAARPRELSAMVGRGIAQDLLGQHAQAQASYRTVLAADPQNLPALNNLALSMVLAGDPGQAVAMLQPLAQRSDAPPRVRNNLSVAQSAANEQAGQPMPLASRHSESLASRTASITPLREALSPISGPDAALSDVATSVDLAGGAARAAPPANLVMAMEPIPDRPRRARPAAKATAERDRTGG